MFEMRTLTLRLDLVSCQSIVLVYFVASPAAHDLHFFALPYDEFSFATQLNQFLIRLIAPVRMLVRLLPMPSPIPTKIEIKIIRTYLKTFQMTNVPHVELPLLVAVVQKFVFVDLVHFSMLRLVAV